MTKLWPFVAVVILSGCLAAIFFYTMIISYEDYYDTKCPNGMAVALEGSFNSSSPLKKGAPYFLVIKSLKMGELNPPSSLNVLLLGRSDKKSVELKLTKVRFSDLAADNQDYPLLYQFRNLDIPYQDYDLFFLPQAADSQIDKSTANQRCSLTRHKYFKPRIPVFDELMSV